jgi:hypothetical protein
MGLMHLPTIPFEQIGIDVLTLPPSTRNKQRYLLVVVDHLTRYVEAFPMPDERTVTVATMLLEGVFTRHGVPKIIISDRGANFTSHIWQELDKFLGIRHNYTLPYNPQADGIVERMNRSIIMQIRKYCQGHRDWEFWLPAILMVNRTTPHKVTGHSPHELLYGTKPRTADMWDSLPDSINTDTPVNEEEPFIQKMQRIFSTLREDARRRLRRAQLDAITESMSKLKELKLEEGDRVWLNDPVITHGKLRKVSLLYKGPYIIQTIMPPKVTVRLAADIQAESFTVHARHLAKVHVAIPEDACIHPDRRPRKQKKLDRQSWSDNEDAPRPHDYPEITRGDFKLGSNERPKEPTGGHFKGNAAKDWKALKKKQGFHKPLPNKKASCIEVEDTAN